jgi:hypothetical protein
MGHAAVIVDPLRSFIPAHPATEAIRDSLSSLLHQRQSQPRLMDIAKPGHRRSLPQGSHAALACRESACVILGQGRGRRMHRRNYRPWHRGLPLARGCAAAWRKNRADQSGFAAGGSRKRRVRMEWAGTETGLGSIGPYDDGHLDEGLFRRQAHLFSTGE